MPKLILHSNDGSPESRAAARVAGRLAKRHSSTVITLHVGETRDRGVAEEAVEIIEGCGREPVMRVGLPAFEGLAKLLVRSWGAAAPRASTPPTRREGRERLPLRPQDIPLGGSRRIRDLALEEFKPISPDATIELALSVASPPHRFDLLLELDRTGRPSGNVEKFHRYDALLTGWARAHDRYKVQGEPPVVVFVVEDEPKARAFLDAAAITGAVVTPGTAPEHWEYPGRERTFFVCERDVHMGTLRSYRLPRYPPEVRKAQRGDHRRSKNRPEPERLPLLERRLLRQ